MNITDSIVSGLRLLAIGADGEPWHGHDPVVPTLARSSFSPTGHFLVGVWTNLRAGSSDPMVRVLAMHDGRVLCSVVLGAVYCVGSGSTVRVNIPISIDNE